MDIYDPQTLGIMVFGGFMVISAVGIALVSTFSMKETSYEEALAKQRREMGKTQPVRTEKKKKDKVSEKKSRGKKKEEKPNGKIPEPVDIQVEAEADSASEPATAPAGADAPAAPAPPVSAPPPDPASALDVQPAAAPAPVEPQPEPAAVVSPALLDSSPVTPPKEKKKKKVAKVEPAPTKSAQFLATPISVSSAVPTSSQSAPNKETTASTPAKTALVSNKSAPATNKSAPATNKSAPATNKSALATNKSAPASDKSAPASNKSAPASDKSAPVSNKSAPASDKSAPAPNRSAPAPNKSAPAPNKSAPAPNKSAPAPNKSAPAPNKSAPAPNKSAPAPNKSAPASMKSAPVSNKSAPASDKSTPASDKSAPASAKCAPAPGKSVATQVKSSSAPSRTAPVLQAVTKDVLAMAAPPVGSQRLHTDVGKTQEPKKKASKKKPAPVADSPDAPGYLPYKALVSTVSNMVLSDGEAHRLIEILSEKANIVQDTWHMATQKGDPVAALKKQLEEREKQLTTEQEDASAAKNRVRELTKELSAERSKVTSVETRLSSQLSKREQEMIALQARMQASYQDHVAQTQTLNAKILSLQDQLEKGPSAQLARLQQENSILRDALNQATSQAESKQNAELAKLRQECTKLAKELAEKTESLLAEEHTRKGLENKVSTAEKQLSKSQASHSQSEQLLQRKLEEVCEELRTTQSRNKSLQASVDKSQLDNNKLSECQLCIGRLEAEIRERSAQVDALTVQLEETKAEKSQLVQQVASINSLLEESQAKKEEVNAAELEQLKHSLRERDDQLNTLHDELKQLQMKHEAAEITIVELEQKNKSEDASLIQSLQEQLKILKEEMVQLNDTAMKEDDSKLQLLQNSLADKDTLVTSLQEELREAKEQKALDESVMAELRCFQTETKESLQSLFPHITMETDQSKWLQAFLQKAQESLSQQNQESQSRTSQELLEKLKEAEESHGSLQTECEQYRTVLAETERMLKHLQKSVEEEELVWKSKLADADEQLRMALEKISKLEAENKSVEQLKEQVILQDPQLEKQSDSQDTSEEVEELKQQLSECQNHLLLAQKVAQAHKEELAQVREQLGEMTMRAEREQNGPAEAQPSQVQSEMSQTAEKLHMEVAQRQQLSEEFEQAQRTITDLQEQLDLLKVSAESPQADTEDVVQLKERLEKEKKLSKDLGQAATKLQQLLKATQEQLSKERETVRTLQEHLEGKGEYVELKEGTSV